MTYATRGGRPRPWPAVGLPVGLPVGLTVFRGGPVGLPGSREFTARPPHAARGAEGGGSAALAIVEYPLPRAGAFPHDPAVGRDGVVWYTDQANSYIGRLDPTTGHVTDYATPTAVSGPHGIIVAPDGAVWYTANFKGRLGRLDPATGTIAEYPLPAEARDPHTPLYHGGRIWFTAQGSNLYGYLEPASGQVKLFPIATPNARP